AHSAFGVVAGKNFMWYDDGHQHGRIQKKSCWSKGEGNSKSNDSYNMKGKPHLKRSTSSSSSCGSTGKKGNRQKSMYVDVSRFSTSSSSTGATTSVVLLPNNHVPEGQKPTSQPSVVGEKKPTSEVGLNTTRKAEPLAVGVGLGAQPDMKQLRTYAGDDQLDVDVRKEKESQHEQQNASEKREHEQCEASLKPHENEEEGECCHENKSVAAPARREQAKPKDIKDKKDDEDHEQAVDNITPTSTSASALKKQDQDEKVELLNLQAMDELALEKLQQNNDEDEDTSRPFLLPLPLSTPVSTGSNGAAPTTLLDEKTKTNRLNNQTTTLFSGAEAPPSTDEVTRSHSTGAEE
ncbi:unnamed protein product, partial [Amoebophrya sp. A120]